MEKIYSPTKNVSYAFAYKAGKDKAQKTIVVSNYKYYHTSDKSEQDFLENTALAKKGLIVSKEVKAGKSEEKAASSANTAAKTAVKQGE